MTISSSVVIMTKDELEKIRDEAFQRGVRRGAFEKLPQGSITPQLIKSPNSQTCAEIILKRPNKGETLNERIHIFRWSGGGGAVCVGGYGERQESRFSFTDDEALSFANVLIPVVP